MIINYLRENAELSGEWRMADGGEVRENETTKRARRVEKLYETQQKPNNVPYFMCTEN